MNDYVIVLLVSVIAIIAATPGIYASWKQRQNPDRAVFTELTVKNELTVREMKMAAKILHLESRLEELDAKVISFESLQRQLEDSSKALLKALSEAERYKILYTGIKTDIMQKAGISNYPES